MIKKIFKAILTFLLPGKIDESRYTLFIAPVVRYTYFINRIKTLFMIPYYRLLMRIFRPKHITRKKYYVSICAIFKDEGPYLREWIELHKIIGIEHFYLYNNFSSDNYLEVLEPYIQSGDVTLIDWPVPQGQMSAYKNCIERFRDETNWFAFIDLDEFIIPNKTDTIGEFMKKFETRPAVLIYWRLFGSSGLIDRDINGLVIEDFKICWKKYTNTGKIIFNTAYELNTSHKKNAYMHHISWGSYRDIMMPPVNCLGELVIQYFHSVHSYDLPIQINHYVTKSHHEYFSRRSTRGDCFYTGNKYDLKYFWEHDKKCQGLDLNAYKYIIPLKLNMSEQSVLLRNRGGVKLLRGFILINSNRIEQAA